MGKPTEDVLGCNISTFLREDSFTKIYSYISNKHWMRIRTACLILSDNKICPKILSIKESDDEKCITFEKITPFLRENRSVRPMMSDEAIVIAVKEKVKKMHKLGYGHGDLHLENIGFKNNEIYLLDFDTVYKIKEEPDDWLVEWMEDGFGWEKQYFENFIKYDFENFRECWLSEVRSVNLNIYNFDKNYIINTENKFL